MGLSRAPALDLDDFPPAFPGGDADALDDGGYDVPGDGCEHRLPVMTTSLTRACVHAQNPQGLQESQSWRLRCVVCARCVPVAASSDEGARNAESMGLHQPLFAALRRKGYRLPTPVQRKTIPLILAGAFTVS